VTRPWQELSRPIEGYFLEDFEVDRVFRHATPRTLTAGDVSAYIALTGARNPVHCSEPLARSLGHPSCPVDDLLVFNIAFGKTVPDISYNAVANLGYADVRFRAPVYVGDTVSCESRVIGVKENSNGQAGVVYVSSTAVNQQGVEVLGWDRWVMVSKRAGAKSPATVIPPLADEVPASEYHVPRFLQAAAMDHEHTGSSRLWDDYEPGDVIDHPGGMTVEEADHMLATRLYQNTARIHFDAHLAQGNAFKRRLVYGGHVISLCRAISYDGLENAFAIAAIHGGAHANPTFAGDTLYCRHVVTAREAIPKRRDVGALRLRMLGVKNLAPRELPALGAGEKHAAVVLDLDYSVLMARRQNP
jgi:2-methylfumaryl-CoA hydratase